MANNSKVSLNSFSCGSFEFCDYKDLHKAKNDFKITINTTKGTYEITIKKDYLTDGMSVPKIFRWFLKSWYGDKDKRSLCGVVHDILYMTSGFNGVFNRDDCDAIFRGMLRITGMSRFVASTADFALFVGGCRHFGDDTLKMKNFVSYRKIA